MNEWHRVLFLKPELSRDSLRFLERKPSHLLISKLAAHYNDANSDDDDDDEVIIMMTMLGKVIMTMMTTC